MCYLTGFLSHNSYDLDSHKFGVPFHLQYYLFRGGDSWSIIFFYIKGIDPNITLTEKIKYIPIVNMLTECEKTQRMEQLKKLKNGIM